MLRLVALVRTTWRNIPEDGILHGHRRENLKSYKFLTDQLDSAYFGHDVFSCLLLLLSSSRTVCRPTTMSCYNCTQQHCRPGFPLRISRQIIFLVWLLSPKPTPRNPGGSMFFSQGPLCTVTVAHSEAYGNAWLSPLPMAWTCMHKTWQDRMTFPVSW
jgi:hypothetical protein